MWLKILAIRYFIKKKKRMIDINPVHSLFNRQELITNEENNGAAKDDLERLLAQMPTPRYAYIIKKLLIEDNEPTSLAKEMNITTANLYNIKHRAMVQLTQVALKDIKEYGK
jgi:DNA-directed RNA polymerase specialized sigma24 family protein